MDSAAISGQLTLPSDSAGPLGPALRMLAPHGYLRWDTTLDRGRDILRRLHRMHIFLATRPQLEQGRVPSVAALRLEFVSSLTVGNWSRAEACIKEIDHWSLDHASATLQMRIRLLEARGEPKELLEFIRLHQAWNFASPRRIAAAIVGAVDVCEIQPVERRDGIQAAYDLFRLTWYQRLVHVIADARGEPRAIRLAAFAAAVDGDERSLGKIVPELPEALASFLQSQSPSEASREAGRQTPGVAVIPTPPVVRGSAVADPPTVVVAPVSGDVMTAAARGDGAYGANCIERSKRPT